MRLRGTISDDGPGWAVLDADGKPKTGRWASKFGAWEDGYLGIYLLSGMSVEWVDA